MLYWIAVDHRSMIVPLKKYSWTCDAHRVFIQRVSENCIGIVLIGAINHKTSLSFLAMGWSLTSISSRWLSTWWYVFHTPASFFLGRFCFLQEWCRQGYRYHLLHDVKQELHYCILINAVEFAGHSKLWCEANDWRGSIWSDCYASICTGSLLPHLKPLSPFVHWRFEISQPKDAYVYRLFI